LAAAGSPLPPAPGAELVYRNCTECHALTTVLAARGLDRPGWSAVLERMEGYGLALSDEERARLLDYLAAQLGDRPGRSRPRAASTVVSAWHSVQFR
ncbi:cytochrome c, partial [Oceanithermus sp.]|uniref:c-type cytochrome n=1 Tax=Oceanithermus sp. TaxID=2268145 RepID=UPI00257C704A